MTKEFKLEDLQEDLLLLYGTISNKERIDSIDK